MASTLNTINYFNKFISYYLLLLTERIPTTKKNLTHNTSFLFLHKFSTINFIHFLFVKSTCIHIIGPKISANFLRLQVNQKSFTMSFNSDLKLTLFACFKNLFLICYKLLNVIYKKIMHSFNKKYFFTYYCECMNYIIIATYDSSYTRRNYLLDGYWNCKQITHAIVQMFTFIYYKICMFC